MEFDVDSRGFAKASICIASVAYYFHFMQVHQIYLLFFQVEQETKDIWNYDFQSSIVIFVSFFFIQKAIAD